MLDVHACQTDICANHVNQAKRYKKSCVDHPGIQWAVAGGTITAQLKGGTSSGPQDFVKHWLKLRFRPMELKSCWLWCPSGHLPRLHTYCMLKLQSLQCNFRHYTIPSSQQTHKLYVKMVMYKRRM